MEKPASSELGESVATAQASAFDSYRLASISSGFDEGSANTWGA